MTTTKIWKVAKRLDHVVDYAKNENKTKNESEKDQITKQIIQVTEELKKVKKEIKMCGEIIDNADKMMEQIRKVEEKEQEKVRIVKQNLFFEVKFGE